jgi:RsiW-degrading membrane proteinase PrsW (M82 family)
MGVSIPRPSSDPAEPSFEDAFDFDEPSDPPLLQEAKRTQRSPSELDFDRDLEFVDSEDELPPLPVIKKKKKKKKAEVEPEPQRKSTVQLGDLLVWVFLLAMVPLAVSVFFPGLPLEQRIQKTIANDPEMLDELAEMGPLEFLSVHDDLMLDGAVLRRTSSLHWLYGLMSVVGFLVLLHAMRLQTHITPSALLLTGFITGTVGVAMLFAFQIFAELSLHMRFFGGGWVTIVIMVIRFIGFSYRSAFDPSSGFILSFVGFTCGVGLCEEICKAAPVFYYLRHARKSDWRGTCLLGFASGVGFGISEGIMYSASYYNGIEPALTYIVRFASCVAFHAVLSGGVALLMFGNQEYVDRDTDWTEFMTGGVQYILVAVLLHGLYDTLVKQKLNLLALIVALVAFGWVAWISKYYWDYDPNSEEGSMST